MKAKILIDDGNPSLWSPGYTPRWKIGEIGEILDNDFQKYDYKVKLPGFDHIDDLFGRGPVDAIRIYYFYKCEVELLEDCL